MSWKAAEWSLQEDPATRCSLHWPDLLHLKIPRLLWSAAAQGGLPIPCQEEEAPRESWTTQNVPWATRSKQGLLGPLGLWMLSWLQGTSEKRVF